MRVSDSGWKLGIHDNAHPDFTKGAKSGPSHGGESAGRVITLHTPRRLLPRSLASFANTPKRSGVYSRGVYSRRPTLKLL